MGKRWGGDRSREEFKEFSNITTHENEKRTHQYLIEFFYPTDQVRVTGGVLKEYIICNRKHAHLIFKYIHRMN